MIWPEKIYTSRSLAWAQVPGCNPSELRSLWNSLLISILHISIYPLSNRDLAEFWHHSSSCLISWSRCYLFGSLFAGGCCFFVFAGCAMDRSIIGADPTFCVEDIEKARLVPEPEDIMGTPWRLCGIFLNDFWFSITKYQLWVNKPVGCSTGGAPFQ